MKYSLYLLALCTLIAGQYANAESYGTAPNAPYTVSSPNAAPQTPAPQPQQNMPQQQAAAPEPQPTCNVNQVTDPRVPPAGSYVIQNSNGSSNYVYTTGDKKPYYVDNPCGNNNNMPPPQVYLQPNMPVPRQ